jgi:transcriptional regulator GlxA family with amidase domain
MTVFILVLENAYASAVAQTLDMLAATARLLELQGKRPLLWKVCGVTREPIALSNGLSVTASPLPRQISEQDICIVPGLGTETPQLALARIEQPDAQKAQRWLVRALESKAKVYASCSAVLLLACTGMLATKSITTSWWLAQTLKQLEPTATVDVAHMVIQDGYITTAGAAMAQADLMLCFIKHHFGWLLADQVSRFVIASQRASQSTYMMPTAHTHGDEFVRRVSQRLKLSLPTGVSIRALASELGLTERTLARRIAATTGKTPLALLQGIRIHEAQKLLENSRLSVEEIASRVGYRDATALRRLLKRMTHATPSQLRHH